MKKYKAEAHWRVKIELVECERETDSCVWMDGRRRNKKGEYENFFDTFDEAKGFCLKVAEQLV